MNLLDWLGRLIDRLDADHEARAAQKARLDAATEVDVTPYEMRIANMRHDANELLVAAQAGELDDWATAQLGEIAATTIDAWRHAVHAMIERIADQEHQP